MKKSLLALAVLAASSGVFAQSTDNFYAEVGYGAIKYSEPGAWATPGVATFKVGMNINPNLAIEGMYGTTANNATFNVGSTVVTFKYDNIYGAYLKGKAEVAPNLEVFGKVGITGASISASIPGYAISDSGSDFSYGAGLQYSFSKTVYVQADYMSYYNKNSISVKGPSVSVGFKF